jgi:hypothetical protein
VPEHRKLAALQALGIDDLEALALRKLDNRSTSAPDNISFQPATQERQPGVIACGALYGHHVHGNPSVIVMI